MSVSKSETNIPKIRKPFSAELIPRVPYIAQDDVGENDTTNKLVTPVIVKNRQIVEAQQVTTKEYVDNLPSAGRLIETENLSAGGKKVHVKVNSSLKNTDGSVKDAPFLGITNGELVEADMSRIETLEKAINYTATGGTVVCYLAPDSTGYFDCIDGNYGYEAVTLNDKDNTVVYAKYFIAEDSTTKQYVGTDGNVYATASGTIHTSITQLKAQTVCKAADRSKFPLFSLTDASKFLAQFRSTSPVDYEIRCAKGEYEYSNGQTISHVDVSEGGRSRLIVTGVKNDATSGLNVFDFNKVISEDNQAYLTTFTFPVAFGNVSATSIIAYGNVLLQYLNLGYREATIDPLGNGNVTASEIPTYVNNQSSFINSRGQIQFRSIHAFGMGYFCYNCDGKLTLSTVGVTNNSDGNLPGRNSMDFSVNANRTIANSHRNQWPLQINTTMSGQIFGSFENLSVQTGTYIRIIGKHNSEDFMTHDDNTTPLYPPTGTPKWCYLFAAQGSEFGLQRRHDSPTRIDVSVEEYKTSTDQVKMFFLLGNAGARIEWGSASVTGYPIEYLEDTYAVYWYNQTTQSEKLEDAISLLKGYDAGKRHADLIWGFSSTGVFLDGQHPFNRKFHFKNTVGSTGKIIDISNDFNSNGTRVDNVWSGQSGEVRDHNSYNW